MKRLFVYIIVVSLSLFFLVNAFAEKSQYVNEEETANLVSRLADNSTIILRYTDIGAISANLSISGDTASCSGRIQSATSGVTTSVSVRLQRSTSGTTWTTIKTWSGSGTNSAQSSGQYTIISGYQYRVSVYGMVFDQNESLLESTTKYSAIKTH